jgi:hypothetical protein
LLAVFAWKMRGRRSCICYALKKRTTHLLDLDNFCPLSRTRLLIERGEPLTLKKVHSSARVEDQRIENACRP